MGKPIKATPLLKSNINGILNKNNNITESIINFC